MHNMQCNKYQLVVQYNNTTGYACNKVEQQVSKQTQVNADAQHAMQQV